MFPRSQFIPLLIAALFPLFFLVYEVLSLTTGVNWDLLNYHLYIADAFWRSRTSNDLLAAGIMSYLPPLVDVPYYYFAVVLQNTNLANGVLAFWQGLNCLLLLFIARCIVPESIKINFPYVLLLLAILGVCSPVGILELTNPTFGDVLTEPFVLGALLSSLIKPRTIVWALLYATLAGLLGGFAVGLKLTNIFFIIFVPICVFVHSDRSFQKKILLLLTYFSTCALAAIVTVGWWYLKIATKFGSPLFPLYTKYFPSDLVTSMGGQLNAFGPRNIFQFIVWPFLISTGRHWHVELGDWISLKPYIWGFIATSVLLLIFVRLFIFIMRLNAKFSLAILGSKESQQWNYIQIMYARWNASREPLTPESRIVLLWLIITFIFWEFFFSLYRYLGPIDAIAPMVLFVLLVSLLPKSFKPVTLSCLVTIVISCSMLFSIDFDSFELVRKKTPLYQVQTPILKDPAETTIVLYRPSICAAGDTWSWVIPFFPKEVGFTQIAPQEKQKLCIWANIPYSKEYDSIQKNYIKERGKHLYILFGSEDFRWRLQRDISEEITAVAPVLKQHGYKISGKCSTHKVSYGNRKGTYFFCPMDILPKDHKK